MEYLGFVGIVFGLSGTIGGVVGFLSYGRAKTIIELQQAEITAREERYNTITAQYIEVKAQAQAAEEKARVLENLVTATPSIEKLATMQGEQHKQVIQALSGVTEQLSALVKAMSDNQVKEARRVTRNSKR